MSGFVDGRPFAMKNAANSVGVVGSRAEAVDGLGGETPPRRRRESASPRGENALAVEWNPERHALSPSRARALRKAGHRGDGVPIHLGPLRLSEFRAWICSPILAWICALGSLQSRRHRWQRRQARGGSALQSARVEPGMGAPPSLLGGGKGRSPPPL